MVVELAAQDAKKNGYNMLVAFPPPTGTSEPVPRLVLILTLTVNPTKSPPPGIYKPTQNPLKKLYNSGAQNWDFIVHKLMLFALPFWKVRIALGYETCFFLFHLPTC